MIAFTQPAKRKATYASSGFARDVADILQRPAAEMRLYSASLIEAGLLPAATETGAAAVATEGARIVAAALGRQVRPASVVRVTGRILAMEHQGDLENMGAPNERSAAAATGETFEARLARTLRGTWEATERLSGPLSVPPNVMVTWNDGGRVLHGIISMGSKTSVYSSASTGEFVALQGRWRNDAVGGAAFTALALLGMAEQIREAVRADRR
ncbi:MULTISPECIES: hypothetical protein [Bradyrhizobium]|uniref:hypothetical protein n=1 Tax=Bradyrhizobium TaxID=374 RepID=UPI0004AF0640|nr:MULTISPECIES: hypothetical protein [Bradyrhizobium]MCP1761152.1 hypothetical protein [Bradyrhizobium japonicum]MCP1792731.1 hypothetical protein [Bradyrhizobium japonicum]MCP1805166.1 hypothetical protein [Bradyrhizobium japonicum]MCP1814183.1 hypothetical protein [Bradyrhizobium japonicum]MCP1874387.1 hypothetical protein [Bradyrhizobium japonicum]